MQYFYIYILILLCFIVAVSYWNTYNSFKESFNPDSDMFILLGDSILQNGIWISEGKSIDYILNERTKGKTLSLAVDGSKIVDVYSQINEIPSNINKITRIFLSVGGNDILYHYVENNNDPTNTDVLIPMFSAYKKVVQAIQSKLPNANIVLLDLYYLDNLKYSKYHNVIGKWNDLIYKYAEDKKNNIEAVLKISEILTKPEDFTFDIEPSSIGGVKLVNEIMESY